MPSEQKYRNTNKQVIVLMGSAHDIECSTADEVSGQIMRQLLKSKGS